MTAPTCILVPAPHSSRPLTLHRNKASATLVASITRRLPGSFSLYRAPVTIQKPDSGAVARAKKAGSCRLCLT